MDVKRMRHGHRACAAGKHTAGEAEQWQWPLLHGGWHVQTSGRLCYARRCQEFPTNDADVSIASVFLLFLCALFILF